MAADLQLPEISSRIQIAIIERSHLNVLSHVVRESAKCGSKLSAFSFDIHSRLLTAPEC